MNLNTPDEMTLLLFSRSIVYDSFETPWTVAHQAPLSVGFPGKSIGVGCNFSSPGYLPNPGIEPMSPALANGCFTTKPPGKPDELTTFLLSNTYSARPQGINSQCLYQKEASVS